LIDNGLAVDRSICNNPRKDALVDILDETPRNWGMGTLGYTDPLVIKGFPADNTSDVYALGTLLTAMLSGLFPDESAIHTLSISSQLRALLFGCASLDRRRRPQSMHEFVELLDECPESTPSLRRYFLSHYPKPDTIRAATQRADQFCQLATQDDFDTFQIL
jgi:serine/threonine protein kinase